MYFMVLEIFTNLEYSNWYLIFINIEKLHNYNYALLKYLLNIKFIRFLLIFMI